jgi:hypothetical protein
MKKITREDGQDIRNPLLATPIKPINEIVIPAAFYKVDNLVFHAFLFALRLGRSKPQPVYARANNLPSKIDRYYYALPQDRHSALIPLLHSGVGFLSGA